MNRHRCLAMGLALVLLGGGLVEAFHDGVPDGPTYGDRLDRSDRDSQREQWNREARRRNEETSDRYRQDQERYNRQYSAPSAPSGNWLSIGPDNQVQSCAKPAGGNTVYCF